MKVFIIILFTMIYFISPVDVFSQKRLKTKKPEQNLPSLVRNDSLSFLPAGTMISKRTKDKIYCFLPQNTLIQSFWCRGGRHRDWETVFYRNGKLAQAWLAKDQKIQGIPCMAASFWTEVFGGKAAVYFYDNGKLAKCKLAKNITIQGHTFKKGEHVRFNRDGKLIVNQDLR